MPEATPAAHRPPRLTVSWFSAGVASAVATKLAIQSIDEVIYTHIDDQHPDTIRFLLDCQAWFGKSITILQSPYRTVAASTTAAGSGFINSPQGPPCSRLLKRRVRQCWELDHPLHQLTYIWGFHAAEHHRANRLRDVMLPQCHRFPLIENLISNEEAHRILHASGIRRPAMYDLGYHNNNCVGCLRGGAGYWNKIRRDFPDVFAARAALERRVGGSCLNGTYLDELDPRRGRHAGPICPDCGIMCQIMGLE